MLFQVNFKTGVLLGAVSVHYDRDLYWGALSLAKYLQYKTPYSFARIHSKAQLLDVAGSEIYSKRLLNTRLMRNDDVLDLLACSRCERAKLLHDRLSKRNFCVRMKKRDLFFPIVELCPRSDPFAIEFDQFVQKQVHIDITLNADPTADPTIVLTTTTSAAAAVTTTTTTTTAADADNSGTVLHYSLETPPRPVSPSLNRFSQSVNSAFRPYSPPTNPPEDPGQPFNFSLPPKKRFYPTTNETEDGIMIWLSGIPPKKVFVGQGSACLEFVPKD